MILKAWFSFCLKVGKSRLSFSVWKIPHRTFVMSITKSHGQSAFELRGSVLTVMVLHIKDPEPQTLYPQITKKIEPGRAFFASAPILIDLCGMDEEMQATFDCQGLADLLRNLGLVPVAIRGAAVALHEAARVAGMGVLPAIKGEKKIDIVGQEESSSVPEEGTSSAEAESDEEAAAEVAPEVEETSGVQAAKTVVVRQPVRSGQQILAPGGDVIVLSSVNAGAEVLAAGNIHVYGALRGRAMAGINGDTGARVFSLQCNPELVAVAGEYVVNEMLAADVVNRSVMIAWSDGSLKFTPLG